MRFSDLIIMDTILYISLVFIMYIRINYYYPKIYIVIKHLNCSLFYFINIFFNITINNFPESIRTKNFAPDKTPDKKPRKKTPDKPSDKTPDNIPQIGNPNQMG